VRAGRVRFGARCAAVRLASRRTGITITATTARSRSALRAIEYHADLPDLAHVSVYITNYYHDHTNALAQEGTECMAPAGGAALSAERALCVQGTVRHSCVRGTCSGSAHVL
jgi:hypothetical protein